MAYEPSFERTDVIDTLCMEIASSSACCRLKPHC